MAKRVSANLSSGVKTRLHELKEHLKLKNESQVVGYLIGLYDVSYENLTVRQHDACLQISVDLNAE